MLTSSVLLNAIATIVLKLTNANSLATGETTVTGTGKTIAKSTIAESPSVSHQLPFANPNADLDAESSERDVMTKQVLTTKTSTAMSITADMVSEDTDSEVLVVPVTI